MASHFQFGRPRQLRCASRLGFTALLMLGVATDAAAQNEWARTVEVPGRPTTPTYVKPMFADNGLVIHAVAQVIFLRDPENGDVVGEFDSGGNIWRSPVLTALPVGDGESWFVFATITDGSLVKLDVPFNLFMGGSIATLQVATTGNATQWRDLQRPGCTSDTLLAEPIVQRRADSNAQFTLEKDIVIVATAHGCGDTTQNQVVAFDAADITQEPVWVFNYGEFEINRIRTCLLDLSRNLLHCTAEHPENSFQNSLFSIDTRTGSLVWAAIPDAGVHARPALGAPGGPGEGHLYVGDQLGRVHTLDPADGTPIYGALDLPRAVSDEPPAVDVDLNVGTGDYTGIVFVVASDGKISGLVDAGTELVTELIPIWDTSLAQGRYVTEAVPLSEPGDLYVGSSDGFIDQLDLATGAREARARLTPGSPSATSETTTLALYQGDDGFHRLVGSLHWPDEGATITQQWKLPCVVTSLNCTWLAPLPPVIFYDGFE